MSFHSDFNSLHNDIWYCYKVGKITDMQFLTYSRRLKSIYELSKKAGLAESIDCLGKNNPAVKDMLQKFKARVL